MPCVGLKGSLFGFWPYLDEPNEDKLKVEGIQCDQEGGMVKGTTGSCNCVCNHGWSTQDCSVGACRGFVCVSVMASNDLLTKKAAPQPANKKITEFVSSRNISLPAL